MQAPNQHDAPQGGGSNPGGSHQGGRPPKGPPIFNAPSIIIWIMGVTIAAHVLRSFLPGDISFYLITKLAYIPARYLDTDTLAIDWFATIVSPFGYMLLHANAMHLFMNMAFLLAFGAVIGRRTGGVQFMVIYAISGLAGALSVQAIDPFGTTPVIGASGAVSGLVGAVAMLSLFPRKGAPVMPRPFDSKPGSLVFVLVWMVLNVGSGLIPGEALGVEGRIAWEAHLGGFVAGFLLMPSLDDTSPGSKQGTKKGGDNVHHL